MVVDHWCVCGLEQRARPGRWGPTRRRTKDKSGRAAANMLLHFLIWWRQPRRHLGCKPPSPVLRLLENGTFFGETQGGRFGLVWERAHASLWRRGVKKQLFAQFSVTQLLVFVTSGYQRDEPPVDWIHGACVHACTHTYMSLYKCRFIRSVLYARGRARSNRTLFFKIKGVINFVRQISFKNLVIVDNKF